MIRRRSGSSRSYIVTSLKAFEAQKEIRTGNYYFKKGSYRAAAGRFAEATRWNSGEPEAWLRLGEAEEKLKDKKLENPWRKHPNLPL